MPFRRALAALRPFARRGPRPLVAVVLLAALHAAAAAAQETGGSYRYELRDAEGPAVRALTPGAEAEPAVPDVSADRTPLRVHQGTRVTLAGPLGGELTWETARVRLVDNAPARAPGLGLDGLAVVRGWRAPEPAPEYRTVRAEVRRGGRDATVAGREAVHHVLEAELHREIEGRRGERYLVTADLWTLEGLPFTWAPFGTFTTSLPAFDPRLRSAIERRLAPLGLVARAVTTVDFELLDSDDVPGDPGNAGSTSRSAFEISALEPAPAPPAGPGVPVVGPSLVAGLEDALTGRPAETCTALAEGSFPEAVRAEVPAGHEEPFRSRLAALCDEQAAALFWELFVAEIERDAEGFCRGLSAAESPAALAEAVLEPAQARGFESMLDAADRQAIVERARPVCRSG